MRGFRVALLTFLLALLVAPLAHGKASVRIVGGITSPITTTPWQVGLLYAGTANTYDAQFCGGTIKDASTIVTAAHCVDGYPASTFDVLAGTATLGNGSGQRIRVTDVAVDPSYEGDGANDVALLKLAAPLSLNSSVQALPLMAASEAGVLDSQADMLLTSGWGSTIGYGPGDDDPTTNFPTSLRNVTVPFVTDSLCGSTYGSNLVAATMLCAGQAGKDSCQGDSGGPLAYNYGGSWRLAGVVSFGAGCGAAGYPGVYTEVASTSITNFLTGVTPPAPEDPPEDDVLVEDDPAPEEEDFDDPDVALVHKQCTRRTCNLLIAVNDDDPSSGVRTVRTAVSSKSKACAAKKAKRKKVCNRKLKTRTGGGGLYTVTATKLRRGRHVFKVTATDNADNTGEQRITIKSR